MFLHTTNSDFVLLAPGNKLARFTPTSQKNSTSNGFTPTYVEVEPGCLHIQKMVKALIFNKSS